jgi:hypothetical protein
VPPVTYVLHRRCTKAFRQATFAQLTQTQREQLTSAASGYVCPLDDAAESFVVGVVVAPDYVPADHAGLVFVAGMVGPVERALPGETAPTREPEE